MTLRRLLQDNPTGAVVTVVAMLVVAAFIAFKPEAPRGHALQAYYYDLDTDELFTDDGSRLPPFTSPSGGEAVRAMVFSCGDCDDAASRFVGYLQKMSAELKQAYESGGEIPEDVARLPMRVRGPDDDEWIAADAPGADAVTSAPTERCREQQADVTPCRP